MMGAYVIGMVIMGLSWWISKQLRGRFAQVFEDVVEQQYVRRGDRSEEVA